MTSSSAERTAVVDIGTLSLERHVRQAFEQAWRLTGARPVGSEHLLRACVAIRGSEAFRALANLLPLTAAPHQPAADVPPLDLYAVPVERSFADSYSVAKRLFTASGSEVWGRDLVTMALLSRNDQALEAIARQAGTTLDDLRAQWRQFLRDNDKHRTTEEWDEWWRAAGLPPVGPPQSGQQKREAGQVADLGARHLIARFDADIGAADDSLNVQRYVDAFARVAASSTLTPPLSVGIFGDWGSGKTFFMDRIENKINELARSENGIEEDLYVRNICQIRFNAWHFAETDLWASLTSTIFKELHAYLDGEDDSDKFAKLATRLEIARALREHTEVEIRQAGNKLQKAEAEVAAAEKKLRDVPAPKPPTSDELNTILKKSLKEVVGGQGSAADTLSELLTEAYVLTRDDAFKTAIEVVNAGKTTVADAKEIFAQTNALTSRMVFWWRVLTAAKVYRRRWFWAVVIAIVAIPVVFFVVERLGFPVSWASATLLQGITVLGALVVWLAKTRARAAPLIRGLDQIQKSVERQIQQANPEVVKNYEDELNRANEAKNAASRDLKTAQRRFDKAEREVADAVAAVQESTSEARLGRFIRGRAGSGDYDKYLGVSAMVREDFDELSSLMHPIDGHRDRRLPSIDRIILYIDDLDRCYPPTKVVRVLEAVHLLLAFPLFVVFVGVDSRWVSRSLNRHYDQLLRDEALQEDTRETSSGQEPANSQDFLEKIFQVPFWLRRMNPAAVRTMLDGLISSDERDDHEGGADERSDGEDSLDTLPVPDHSTVPRPTEIGHNAAQPEEGKSDVAAESMAEPAAAATETLRIRAVEREFMDRVAPLMPRTPRAVKRFVNIYRLYKAALSPSELETFLDREGHPGNFRAVQVLLALVIGTPDFAKAVVEVLSELNEPTTDKLSDLPARLPTPQYPIWQTTLDSLAAFAKRKEHNLPLVSLREVSPMVTRYSLHHMVSAPPDESTLG